MNMKMNVGVVDDDPELRRMICAIIEAEGHRVLEADCLQSAMRLIQDRRGLIDTLVSDLQLGGGDGLEGLEVLAAARHHGIQNLALCSGTINDSVENDHRAQGVVCIKKPSIIGPLQEFVQRAAMRIATSGNN